MFRYEFHDADEFAGQMDMFFAEYPEEDDDKDETDHWPKLKEADRLEISAKVGDLLGHIEEIDQKIGAAVVGWKLERVGKAELSILRIAVYEILYDENIETPIAINEAVNLSKKYCDEKAHAFVNGVLAKFA